MRRWDSGSEKLLNMYEGDDQAWGDTAAVENALRAVPPEELAMSGNLRDLLEERETAVSGLVRESFF